MVHFISQFASFFISFRFIFTFLELVIMKMMVLCIIYLFFKTFVLMLLLAWVPKIVEGEVLVGCTCKKSPDQKLFW